MTASSLTLDRVGTVIGRLSAAEVSLQEYAGTVLTELRRAVGFDGWCLDLADPESSLPIAVAFADPPLGERLPQFWWFEFQHASHGLSDVPVHAAAARRDPAGARRFAELLSPGGVADELRCWFVADRIRWGSLNLFRSQGSRPFTRADAADVNSLLLSFAAGARHAWLAAAPLREDSGGTEPGTLLYGQTGALISQTPAARRWLAQLGAGHAMIAAMLAMLETTPTASLRTRTATGTWLRVSGGRLVPPVGAATVAITIQPATPAEITPLLLRGYGLTPRQQSVARLVLAGQSTQRIASALQLSHHTVNDHVRAIAAKTGVRSRGQLAAVLTGSPSPSGANREIQPLGSRVMRG